jgi:hypothetical protein
MVRYNTAFKTDVHIQWTDNSNITHTMRLLDVIDIDGKARWMEGLCVEVI